MSVSQAWAAEADMENRDPNALNEHLKVSYEDVIGEPEHTHSMDCVWKFSYKCFNLWKTLCYVIATTLCGIPMAMCWGCYFACVAFCHIWNVTPSIRALQIECSITRKMNVIITETCITPCCDACSNIFNAFRK